MKTVCIDCKETFTAEYDDFAREWPDTCPGCAEISRQIDAWESEQERKIEAQKVAHWYGYPVSIGGPR